MSNGLSLLLACCNPHLKQDKEYLIYISKNGGNELTMAKAYGPRNRLGKLDSPVIFDLKTVGELIKSKYKKGYVLKKVDGNDCLTSTLHFHDCFDYLKSGLEKFSIFTLRASKVITPDITSTPISFINNDTGSSFEYSPNW